MPAPLEDIGWLTRSANRVQLLELLADQPYTRPELTEEIGVTRVTVNRMIEAFEERGWIEVPVRDPEITPCGRLVLDHLEPFREAATTARKLRDIQGYLPVEAFDFDLRRLADADVSYPSQHDILGPLEESRDIAVGSERLRIVGSVPDSIHLRSAFDRYEEGNGPRSVERVFTAGGFESVRSDPDMSRWLRKIPEFDHIECGYFRYEDDLSYGLAIADGTVVLQLLDDQGFVPAIVTSDDEAVLAWAERTFERYKREAEPLDVDAFTA
jgi:predicted transcriptional regulator